MVALQLGLLAMAAVAPLVLLCVGWDRDDTATSARRIATALPCVACAAVPSLLLRFGGSPFWQVLVPTIGAIVIAACPVNRMVRRSAQILSPVFLLFLVALYVAASNSEQWMARDASPARLIELREKIVVQSAADDVVAAGFEGKEYPAGSVDDVFFPAAQSRHELARDCPVAEWHSSVSGLYRRRRVRSQVVFKGGIVSGEIDQFSLAPRCDS